MKAVIMAGGMGTRMADMFPDVPKSLIVLDNQTILERQLDVLCENGIHDVTLVLGHLSDYILETIDDCKSDMNIDYYIESTPLGTGGALFELSKTTFAPDEDYLLIFGDLYFDMNLNKLVDFHKFKKSNITIVTHPSTHVFDSDVVIVGEDDEIQHISKKGTNRLYNFKNLTSAGIYCINNSIFSKIKRNSKKIDLFQIVDSVSKIYSYKTSEYIKDVGTESRYNDVLFDIANNVPILKNLHKTKQKAVFLDRDGTINRLDKKFVNRDSDFELYDFSADAIKLFNDNGYLVIVITNQGGISLGYLSPNDLDEIHNKMETEINDKSAYVDDILYCPHYFDNAKNVGIKCKCRKPEIGMIEEAVKKYNIDLSNSWIIGDTTTDIKTGKNVSLKTVLVKTGFSGNDKKYDVSADYEFDNLFKAAQFICGRK